MSEDEHASRCLHSHTDTHSMRGVDEANEASGSRETKSPRERQRDQTQGGGRVFASVRLDLCWIDALFLFADSTEFPFIIHAHT